MSAKRTIWTQLRSEHDEVKSLLQQADNAKPSQREGLIKKIRSALIPHARAEEKTLYSFLREADTTETLSELTNEAYAEHEAADHLLSEVEKTPVNDETWKGRFLVFKENIERHIKEEEKELFGKARKYINDDTAAEILEAFELEKKHFQTSLPSQHQIKPKKISAHLRANMLG